MKMLKRIIVLMMIMVIGMTQISFAATNVEITSDEDFSIGTYQNTSRGQILAEGTVEIGNPRDGSIFICIYTVAYRNVDRIFHTVFLEQWDEDREDWVQKDSWSFEDVSENCPNGLSLLRNTFTVSGYPWNKVYRVRGLHGIEYMEEIEACATETDGLLITKN